MQLQNFSANMFIAFIWISCKSEGKIESSLWYLNCSWSGSLLTYMHHLLSLLPPFKIPATLTHQLPQTPHSFLPLWLCASNSLCLKWVYTSSNSTFSCSVIPFLFFSFLWGTSIIISGTSYGSLVLLKVYGIGLSTMQIRGEPQKISFTSICNLWERNCSLSDG